MQVSNNKNVKSSKKIANAIIILIIVIPSIVFIINTILSLIKADIWTKEEKVFNNILDSEFSHDNLKASFSATNEGIVHNWINYFEVGAVEIDIAIYCEETVTNTEKLGYISRAKDFFKEYVNTHEDCLFYNCEYIHLEITAYSPEITSPIYVYFNDYFDTNIFGKGINHTIDSTKQFDKLLSYDEDFSMAGLQNFSDCKQIEVRDVKDIQVDCDFTQFKNLEYLHIVLLDFEKDKIIIDKIEKQLPKGCKFFVSNHGDFEVIET